MSWSQYHSVSEQHATEAELAAHRGEPSQAIALYGMAAKAESQAIHFLHARQKRTLGITVVSAASLWYKAHEEAMAKQVADHWLASGALPEFAIRQLQALVQALTQRRLTMPRAPFVKPTDNRVVFENKNPIAQSREFRDIFDQCFGGTILPERGTFRPEAAPLYISKRVWRVDQDFTPRDPDFAYEEYLDRLFWDETSNRRLTFLVGGIGCGKSTLIDFYLRSFCPHVSENREKFLQKLIIHVDVKGIPAVGDFTNKFFNKIKERIEERCNQGNFPISQLVGQKAPQDVGRWVEAALLLISNKIRDGDVYMPFKFLVIVIDNLDQTHLDVQKRALLVIRDWLEPDRDLKIWRAYVPMWPQTLDRLFNALGDPISKEKYSTVQVGAVPGPAMIDKRTRRVIDRIRLSAIALTAAAKEDDDDDTTSEDTPIPTVPLQNFECWRYVQDTHEFAFKHFVPFLQGICNGDLRRQLTIWDNLLSGQVAYFGWLNFTQFGRRSFEQPRVPYELLDGALTGKTKIYNRDKTRIENIFSCGGDNLLLGPLTLHTLSFENQSTERSVFATLDRLGYDDEILIHGMLERFLDCNMFHQVAGLGSDTDYIVHKELIGRYLEILREPAYLDNVAVVTPVETHLHNEMRVTLSRKREAFTKKVGTTLAFLKQLRIDEEQFSRKQRFQNPAALLQAQKECERIALPSFWKAAALRYRERLIALRDAGHFENVTAHWWKDTIESGILRDAEKAPERLMIM